MIVVTYLLRQSITLYKNLGGLEQNLGGLKPLSPIASAATGPRPLLPDPNGQERRRTPQHTWALLADLNWQESRRTPQHTWALLTDFTQLESHTPQHMGLC